MTDDSTVPQFHTPRLHIADGPISVGETMYSYDAYSMGVIREAVYDGDKLWDSRYVRQRFAHTPQRAAELGLQRCRSNHGRFKVHRALKRFING